MEGATLRALRGAATGRSTRRSGPHGGVDFEVTLVASTETGSTPAEPPKRSTTLKAFASDQTQVSEATKSTEKAHRRAGGNRELGPKPPPAA